MPDKKITVHDYPSSAHLETLYHDNGNGTYSPTTFVVNSGQVEVTSVPSKLSVVDSDFTQLITIADKDAPQQGPDAESPDGWYMSANPDNVGSYVWFMPHGQTKALKGYPVSKNAQMYLNILNPSDLDFTVDNNGDKIHLTKV